jgi:hypothetical protein
MELLSIRGEVLGVRVRNSSGSDSVGLFSELYSLEQLKIIFIIGMVEEVLMWQQTQIHQAGMKIESFKMDLIVVLC